MLKREAKLERALKLAKEKLEIYRKHSSGEYMDGMEYRELIFIIDEALNDKS